MVTKKNISIIIATFLIILFFTLKPYYIFLTQTLKISPLKTLLSMNSLKTFDNQVNFLILGIAGIPHEGPNLSDSIIFANYNLKTNQLTTVSIPRDIWSETLKDKINTAYAYGESKQKGGGLKLAKAEVSSIVGQPIHYAAIIDFNRFKKLIDFLGGVEVNVERPFTDKKYPIEGKENDSCGGDQQYRCRYETISFKKGKILMDGSTALKFVRSRNAEGVEGSDFARGKRQQKVIEAIKNKLIGFLKTADLKKLKSLYLVLDELITRDITNQQMAIIIKNIFLKRNFHQKEIVLTEDFFLVPSYSLYDGKYVLIPKDKSFKLLHQYIDCEIKNFPSCHLFKKES